MKWLSRAFVSNPGGAYDPAPLHDFDLVDVSIADIPSVGDVLYDSNQNQNYIVKRRVFCFLENECELTVSMIEDTLP